MQAIIQSAISYLGLVKILLRSIKVIDNINMLVCLLFSDVFGYHKYNISLLINSLLQYNQGTVLDNFGLALTF